MTRWFAIIGFVLFLAGALLSGCDNATPPVAGPNMSPNPPEDSPISTGPESEDYLFSDNTQIVIPPIPAISPPLPCAGCDVSSAISKPSAVISSNSGAFTPFSDVTVQVVLTENFQGNSPQVGPADGGTRDQILPSVIVRSNAEGSISFGVYVSYNTTPDKFTFSATQGITTLTISLDFVTLETVN